MGSRLRPVKVFQSLWAIAFFGWSAILLVLAVLPSGGVIKKSNEDTSFRLDYLEHFLVFVFFSLLYGLWRRKILTDKNKELVFLLLFGGMFAAFDEAVQLFVDSRTFNPVDLLFNMCGLLVGAAITRIYIFK